MSAGCFSDDYYAVTRQASYTATEVIELGFFRRIIYEHGKRNAIERGAVRFTSPLGESAE
jgi:hypothetical protein